MALKRYSLEEFRSVASDPAKASDLSGAQLEREEAFHSVEPTLADGTKAYEKAIEVAERDLVFRMSDATIDRHNDTIDPTGWKFEAFMRSGSLLWAHDATRLPLAKPVELWVERGALYGQFRFPSPGKHAMSDTVFDLFKEGTLKGVSVGFKPMRWEFIAQRLENGQAGVDFKEQELLELSATPVPANSNAVVVRAITKLATAEITDELQALRGVIASLASDLKALAELPRVAPAPLVEEKAGRVLSRANKGKLRSAHGLIDEVIRAQKGCEDPACTDPDCEDPEHMKAAPAATISVEPSVKTPTEVLTKLATLLRKS
jgi:HK97 family phage prohead protease